MAPCAASSAHTARHPARAHRLPAPSCPLRHVLLQAPLYLGKADTVQRNEDYVYSVPLDLYGPTGLEPGERRKCNEFLQ